MGVVDATGASCKHPVTVIRRSGLEGPGCGEAGVCAFVAAAAKATIAVNTPGKIRFVMLPPAPIALQRSDHQR
jgi:hypothetical protein